MESPADQVMEALDREHLAVLARIRAANADLQERLESLGVTVSYDREDDVLMLLFGRPEEAMSESIDNTLLLRVHPETLKIVGVEVVGLRAHLADRPDLFDLFLDAMEMSGDRVVTGAPAPNGRPSERIVRRVQDLVLA